MIINPNYDQNNADDVDGMELGRECLINYPKKPMIHEIRRAEAKQRNLKLAAIYKKQKEIQKEKERQQKKIADKM